MTGMEYDSHTGMECNIMRREEVEAWLDAMKSGRYIWTQLDYFAFIGSEVAHCPLGVLIDLEHPTVAMSSSNIETALGRFMPLRLQNLIVRITEHSYGTYEAVIADIEGALEEYITL